MNQLKVGAILSYVNIAVSIGVGLVYTPFMMHTLGQSEYGLYSLVGSVTAYLNVLDMGLANTLVRYVARNREVGTLQREKELYGLFFFLYGIIGIVTLLAGYFVYLNLDALFGVHLTDEELSRAEIMTILLVVNVAVTFPFSIFASIMQAYERFIVLRVVNIARSLLQPVIIVPLLLCGYGSVMMVVVAVVLNILCLILNAYYCIKYLHVGLAWGHFEMGFLKEIAGYSFFIFLNAVMDKVYWGSGQFVLGIVSGTIQVAVYAVVMQFLIMFMSFSNAISGVFLPRITMLVAKGVSADELTDIMIRIGRLQLYVIGMIISIFFLIGKEFLWLWAGDGYIDAYPMILLLMAVMTIPLIQNVGISILMAMNLNRYRMTVYSIFAFICFICSFPAAKAMGTMGCAVVTAISIFVSTGFFMNRYYKRKVHIDIGSFWHQVSRIWLGIIVFTIIAGMFKSYALNIDNWTVFITYAFIFALVYVGCMYRLCMNEYEKSLLFNAIGKFEGRR